MLETDEVDVDLFTPAPGTSLASIFNANQIEPDKENTTLKYVPQTPAQPPQEPTSEKPKSASVTNCIFATAISGYEWTNGTYNLHENLGFAIIKSATDNTHHLFIYTSEKRTLSLATINSTFIVNVKKDVSISYYDNFKKYWLICAPAAKIANIVDCLQNINVNIKHSTDENVEEVLDDTVASKKNVGSDGDLSNSKDSILKRMANMGQSVLPQLNNVTVQSTDSTDEHDDENNLNFTRHKLTKNTAKRSTEKNSHSTNNHLESNKPHPPARPLIENSTSILPLKQELALIKNTDLKGPSNTQYSDLNSYDMHSFISEQRISNTELRINVNRLSDKLELLTLNKASELEKTQSTSKQPMNIVEKLIKEYESKIMIYENFIKSKGFDCSLILASPNETSIPNSEDGKGNDNLQLLCQEKDKEIEDLKNKLQIITESHATISENYKTFESFLLNEINELKKDVTDKNDLITKMDTNIQVLMENHNKNDMNNKIKKLMNNTYQTISMNFNDDENYPGATVKTIVGAVIKNSTLESFYDNNCL
ncbi:uncharacterized protein LOC123699440 [Colias croceus]|uniref:uncharacterized protein LOC123699440 n=1 Tax=Colias crocea TaxID=72248 RepID=UPI001E27D772|nr:uncharacterized protein LOC123699440 [Colias croceus]